MCLVKMKVEHEDETPPPPRRIIVRPVSSERMVSVSRPLSHHSHISARRLSTTIVDPSPRPAQYIMPQQGSRGGGGGGRASVPRIIHAPSPPRSRERERVDLYVTSEGPSPRGSRTSVRSRESRYAGGGSARASRAGLDNEVVYVDRRRSTRERPRSGHFLTAGTAEVTEAPRQTLYLDDSPSRTRSRSITYATTGLRASRERVLVEDGGRRRESYRTLGSI